MTDDEMHGAEHDPHAEVYEHQQPADETWSGGAPVDDFGGEEESATAAAVSDEAEAPVESVEAPRKSGKLLPVIIVILGVGFLGVMGYMQLGGVVKNMVGRTNVAQSQPKPSAPEPIPSVAPKTAMVAVPTPNADASPATSPTTQTGVAVPSTTNNMGWATAVATPTSTPTSAAMPVPMAAPAAMPAPPTPTVATVGSSVPADTGIPANASVTATATPTPIAPVPVPAALNTAPTPLAAPAPVVTAAVPAPVAVVATKAASATPVASAADDSRLAALASRVDDLQKSLTKATQQLTAISDKLSATPSLATSATASPVMEDRLNKLEQKVMQIEHTAPAASTETASLTLPVDSGVKSMAEEEKPVPAPSPKTHHKATTAHHKTAKAKTTPHHHTQVATTKKNTWILRAASEDQAWVSKSSTSAALRPVQVGDDLPGIGRVTAIRENADGWEVDGTSGSIH